MTTSVIQIPSSTPPAVATQTTAVNEHRFRFHEVLSALNPLQYLPVVGTIYRAMTGDVIPEALRDGGSLLVSGLLGGPIGLITYIATTIAEKITGVDPEKIVAAALNPAPPAVAATAGMPTADSAPAQITPAPAQFALTQQQLAAYGVSSDASGTLKLGDVQGADVLNIVELARLGDAAAAYAANQPPPIPVAARGG